MKTRELEKLRKKLKKRMDATVIVTLIISVILTFFLTKYNYYNSEYNIIIIFGTMIICMFIGGFINRNYIKEYRKGYKEIFILKGLNDVFDNLVYEPSEGIPYEVLDNTHMINTGDKYKSNDYISGDYKGVHFEQSDVFISISKDNILYRDDHEEEILLEGRWLIFEFNKQFKGNILVSKNLYKNKKLKKNNLVSLKNDKEKYEIIKTESVEFNEKFTVYAEDGAEAFYILTPTFMKLIEELLKIRNENLVLCFVDNKLHIGISNGEDAFEIPSYEYKINSTNERKKINSDIKVITNFVDKLQLDNKLFKK